MSIKTCAFWECRKPIPAGGELCGQHIRDHQTGELDRCEGCGRLKSARYELCLDCFAGHDRRRTGGPVETPEAGYAELAAGEWNLADGGFREERSL